MKIHLKKHNGALIPVDQTGQDYIDGLKRNTWYSCEMKKPRNGKFHSKFFLLLGFVVDNSDFYSGMPKPMGIENLLNRVKFTTGHYETYKIGDVLMAKTKSIAFAKMDNIQFEEFYTGACAAIIMDEELGITELGDF